MTLATVPLNQFDLPDPAATDALGHWLGARLGAGDVLLLEGPVGAGKSHLARALILSRLSVPEDVPSPSFTLVQVYQAPGFDIWHADLYRLSGPSEIEELGLIDAFNTALCLIEWPDRLADLRPPHALTLSLALHGDGRSATLTGPPARLARLLGGDAP